MGLMDFIFKRTPKVEIGANSAQTSVQENSSHISIPSLNFHGMFVSSDNKKFKLAWHHSSNLDSYPKRKVVDCVNYVLLDGSRVIAKGYMESPDRGKVANNGTFILQDNGKLNELSGTLYAFDVSGKNIIRREFKANLGTSDLSIDGRFAACQTANSDDINDSGALTVFDLSKGIELAQWYAESSWPSFYEFYPEDEMIGLGDSHLGVFRYSLTGEFIDREAWQEANLLKGKYWHVLMMSEKLIKDAEGNPSPVLAEKLLISMNRIKKTIPKNNEGGWKAMCLKLQGICLESKGDMKNALTYYDDALVLNPKIGVKQRANKIKKALGI